MMPPLQWAFSVNLHDPMSASDALPTMIRSLLPHWNPQWLTVAVLTVQIVLILTVAALVRLLLRQVLRRLCTRYSLPAEMMIGIRRVGSFVISVTAVLTVLNVLGVSSGTLWTAFTGFAAVGAVAFFAAWSVLSNIFCTFLIITTRPFRLHDHIELLEGGDKPGLKGRVIDINVIYTTLEETGDHAGSVLQVPNSLFFQRTTRRWRETSHFNAN
ncbi:putative mechanosensitive ion channel MscS [Xanthomonas arboricola pv. fragariae]|nr:putative mechanosensitive ion channel MscS [Xanthomonas arboricola pv. fragariae]